MTELSFPEWPRHTAAEMDLVHQVLKSGKTNYWAGEFGRTFECAFGSYVGASAVSVSNGTIAIEACCRALGLGENDKVIVTSRSFVASAAVLVWLGITPVFCDIDPATLNMDISLIDSLVDEGTKAILAVHYSGCPCDMRSLRAIANKHNLFLIEYCAQAHGAFWGDASVGSIGDISAWSFCYDKIISSGGEGGCITSKNEVLINRVRELRDHGKRQKGRSMQPPNGPFPWLHDTVGSNWRMTEIQSALALGMLERLGEMVLKRRENYFKISELLAHTKFYEALTFPTEAYVSCYKGIVRLSDAVVNEAPAGVIHEIVDGVRAKGIPVTSGGCGEIYREALFKNYVPAGFRLPVAREMSERILMFPVHPTIDDNLIETIAREIIRISEEVLL